MSVGTWLMIGEVYFDKLIATLNVRQVLVNSRLRTAVRLYVRVVSAEQFFSANDRGLLDDIGPFTTAVITFSGIAFGVLVREYRAGSFQHGFADKVFAGD